MATSTSAVLPNAAMPSMASPPACTASMPVLVWASALLIG